MIIIHYAATKTNKLHILGALTPLIFNLLRCLSCTKGLNATYNTEKLARVNSYWISNILSQCDDLRGLFGML